MYSFMSMNILNPNNTNRSPVPNGFFNIFDITIIKREAPIPTIRAFWGIWDCIMVREAK